MDEDQYGIPLSVFGPIDPELPALIGRIVMLSALAETKVDALASSLSRAPQSSTAGRNFGTNLGTCRTALAKLEGPRKPFARSTLVLLNEVDEAMQARHAVVHRVWPRAAGQWGGWKPIPPGKRDPGAVEWSEWQDLDRERLVADVRLWVALLKRLDDALGSG